MCHKSVIIIILKFYTNYILLNDISLGYFKGVVIFDLVNVRRVNFSRGAVGAKKS